LSRLNLEANDEAPLLLPRAPWLLCCCLRAAIFIAKVIFGGAELLLLVVLLLLPFLTPFGVPLSALAVRSGSLLGGEYLLCRLGAAGDCDFELFPLFAVSCALRGGGFVSLGLFFLAAFVSLAGAAAFVRSLDFRSLSTMVLNFWRCFDRMSCSESLRATIRQCFSLFSLISAL